MSENEAAGMQARIKKLSADKKAAIARIAELESQLGEMTPQLARVDALVAQVGDLETRLAQSETHSSQTSALVAAGVTDPDSMD